MTLARTDSEALGWFKQLEEHCLKNPDGAMLSVGLRMREGTVVRHEGVDYPVQELHVTIHAMSGNAPVKHTLYRLASSEGGDRLVHQLSAEIGSTRFRLVTPDGLKSKRIGLRIGRKNPRERAESRRKQKKARKNAAKRQRKKG